MDHDQQQHCSNYEDNSKLPQSVEDLQQNFSQLAVAPSESAAPTTHPVDPTNTPGAPTTQFQPWHIPTFNDYRHHMIYKIYDAISTDIDQEEGVTREEHQILVVRARKIEADIYQKANSADEYNSLIEQLEMAHKAGCWR